jgi:hypothetical protein
MTDRQQRRGSCSSDAAHGMINLSATPIITAGRNAMQRHHDMGGMPAGPIDRGEHDYAPWEKRVDAILRLLIDPKRGVMTVDELRRNIEELGPGAYDEMSYYQRWMASIGNNLLEKGVIGVDELGRKMAEVEAKWQAAKSA